MSSSQDNPRKTEYELEVNFTEPDDELILHVPTAAQSIMTQRAKRREAQELTNDVGQYIRRVGGDYVRWPQIFEIVDSYVELVPTPESEPAYIRLIQLLDRSNPPDEAQATLWHNIHAKRPLEATFRVDGRYPDILDGSTPPYTPGILYSEESLSWGPGLVGLIKGTIAVLKREGRPDLAKHFLDEIRRGNTYRAEEGVPGLTNHELMCIVLQYISISTNTPPDASRLADQNARLVEAYGP